MEGWFWIKFLKKIGKKFAGKEKVVIFAARFDRSGQLFDNIER